MKMPADRLKIWVSISSLSFTIYFTTLFLLLVPNLSGSAQTYYVPNGWIWSIQLEGVCNPCTSDSIGFLDQLANGGASFGPDGQLYTLSSGAFYGASIFQVDVLNANATLLFQGPVNTPDMYGFVAAGGGIFYSTPNPIAFVGSDELYKWDLNAGSVTMVGHTGYPAYGEMCVANGLMYTLSWTYGETERKIIQIDPINPANSQVITTLPYNVGIFGLSASPISNTLIGTLVYPGGPDIILISLIDGTYTTVCEFSGYYGAVTTITSPLEWGTDPMTDPFLDLDCDNSSGAFNSDFNGESFNCLSENGVGIADHDIIIEIDAPIANLTAELINPIPDGSHEALFISGAAPGISISGSGTTLITLTNTGNAKISDFSAALQLINYFNSAFSPTAGQRTIKVQFTTAIGTMSNVAKAYVYVTELPQLTVDLGPDPDICEGESTQLDAGHPGADFHWSTGETGQTINVDTPGIYSVTVSDGIKCPNADEVQVNVLPVVHVSLVGDTLACQGGTATLILVSDAPFPVTIEVSSSTGGNFLFNDVLDTLGFIDFPFSTTEYLIENITSTEPACFVSDDNYQVIEVHPNYMSSASANLCEGDSILLGNQWVSGPGDFDILFNSVSGCDSVVHYVVSLLPAVHLYVQDSTCDPSQSGVFNVYLSNPNGCDTVVQTHVTLLSSDTLTLFQTTCHSDSAGIFIQNFTNQAGCDSVILTHTTLLPPMDTTFLFQFTCDSSAVGVFPQIQTNQAGCDSLVLTSVQLFSLDTTFLTLQSCDTASLGVFYQVYDNVNGCDSLVITTITPGIPDTSYIHSTSCDSNTLGYFEQHFTTMNGCDSTVFTTVTYSANDSTWIAGKTCDSLAAGIFVQNLINRYGCDSIVTESVSLLPKSETWNYLTTCDPTEAGFFTDSLLNQFGCDSLVHRIIDLLPADTTHQFSHTCSASAAGIFTSHFINQFGCDSAVMLMVIFQPPDTTVLTTFTCHENEVGSDQTILMNQFGCDSIVITNTNLYPLPALQLEVTSDFNGYAISCSGGNDGSVLAVADGEPPFTFMWSNGITTATNDELSAGTYFITITDGFGCMAEAGISLNEPTPLSISLVVNEPDCFDNQEGRITVIASGGAPPYSYSLNGGNYQSSNIFTGLSKGTYQMTTLDANYCDDKEIVWVNVPIKVNVALGDDEIINIGDTAFLNVMVDIPFDSLSSIEWSGGNTIGCPNCIQQPVSPIITTAYSVTVTSVDGCTDSDDVTVIVNKDYNLFVPNVFSPNGDQINDRLWVGAGTGIKEISSLTIFDRWGNMVFRNEHFPPNDPDSGWDGRMKGKDLQPAVFTYQLFALTKEGGQIHKYGDLTLIR